MTASTEKDYVGTELDLFERAVVWRGYLHSAFAAHLRGNVLEVGAGKGSHTGSLVRLPGVARWVCLEPDAKLAGEIRALGLTVPGGSAVEVRVGITQDLPAAEKFDTILYVDVLEHIELDGEELARARAHLAPGGRLVVLVPAHQFLFSPFDSAIGHFRRYDRALLRSAARSAPGLRELGMRYLDSVGLLASLANRALLRQGMPTPTQIQVWDSLFVRASRLMDPLLGHQVGKSLLGVWEAV